MGSIRPPHRLKYTIHTDNDKCNHPQCKGTTADTEHIFWHCEKWGHVRKPYLHQLELYKASIHSQGDREQAVDELLCLPCFRQCGICLGDERMLRTTYGISDEYIQNISRNTTAPPGASYKQIHEQQYLRAYTDGSCTDGTRRERARAGWGVYYADNATSNHCSKLGGPVQTSYRAGI